MYILNVHFGLLLWFTVDIFRCANCYECPSCGNTLSTRATAVAIASDNPEEKATAKKVFYLACGFCRWSTRDVGIPDRSNGKGGFFNVASETIFFILI